jgi:hypothetical protein
VGEVLSAALEVLTEEAMEEATGKLKEKVNY